MACEAAFRNALMQRAAMGNAKLLGGKRLLFGPFLWNRFLRLAPLLILVIIVVALRRWFDGTLDMAYVKQIAKGILFPTLPNGGWSITVESHFYLVLPFLLYLSNRSNVRLLMAIPCFLALIRAGTRE